MIRKTTILSMFIGIALISSMCGNPTEEVTPDAPAPIAPTSEETTSAPIVEVTPLPKFDIPKVSVLFMVDRTESVRVLCDDPQENLGFLAPKYTKYGPIVLVTCHR